MIIKGNILKLEKKIPGINYLNIGDEFKVEEISENGVIIITCSYGTGIMSYEELQEYFSKVEPKPVKPVRVWSKWFHGRDIEIISEGEKIKTEYRTNSKRLEVRTVGLLGGEVKATASCHEEDTFNAAKGLELAEAKLKLKILKMLF